MTINKTVDKATQTEIFRFKIDRICEAAQDYTADIVAAFGITCKETDTKFIGPCPVHGGDNPNAWHLSKRTGRWACYTHQCHSIKNYGSNLIGLVKGIRRKGFTDAVNYLSRICKFDFDTPIDGDIELRQFNKEYIERTTNKKNKKISRHYLRQSLIIPAEYYINRGYSARIINAYDIGLCTRPGSFMENRVIVPVWESPNSLAGLIARTIFEDYKERGIPKWLSNTGFNKYSSLFNYYNAAEHIQNDGVVILVEGIGDVLRLEEAGIKNSVAMFGTVLTVAQQKMLESSGAMSLIVFTDSDNAGQISLDEIRSRCKHSFNIISPKISKKDAGEMTIAEIKQDILPIVEKYKI